MAEFEAVLAEALEDIKAGRPRTLPDYLSLVPRSDRAELAELLAIFYMRGAAAAGPEPVDAVSYERALGVIDRLSAGGPAGNLPAALKELRRTRRMRRDEVVAALAERCDVETGGLDRLRRSYHELETGLLSGRGLSRRLLAALGEILRVDPEDLAAAAARTTKTGPRPGQSFARGIGAVEPRRSMAGSAQHREPARERAEQAVDALFRGGRDA